MAVPDIAIGWQFLHAVLQISPGQAVNVAESLEQTKRSTCTS
jgi:hypothetical protein